MVAYQGEYRFPLAGRFGAVVFGGNGKVARTFGEMGEEPDLWSVGERAGRYRRVCLREGGVLIKSKSYFLLTALLGAACVLVAPGAAAQNWVTLLKNTPAESFDDEDLRLFLDTARKVLDGGAPENQPVTWENPKSRNRGEMTVLRNFESKGRSCKEVRVRNESRGRKSDNRRILCKVDERWRLVSEAQLKKEAKQQP